MRIRTLAVSAVLASAATIPLATTALAQENGGCMQRHVELAKVVEARADDVVCRAGGNHPIGLPHLEGHDPRQLLCPDAVREVLRHLDPGQLRERLRNGDWPKDWPEDWKKNCASDSQRDHDDDPAAKKDRKHDDSGDKSDDSDDSSDNSSSDNSSSDDNSSDDNGDGDDNDETSTSQVKVVPRGSVDTGDGSTTGPSPDLLALAGAGLLGLGVPAGRRLARAIR